MLRAASAVRNRLRVARPTSADAEIGVEEIVDAPSVPRRPMDGVALLLMAPIATLVLLRGVNEPLLDAVDNGRGPQFLGFAAVALLVGQTALGVVAAVLALRGSERGIDLTSVAMIVALGACILLYLAGVRLDYVVWGSWLLVALGGGLFRLDAPAANAFYHQRAHREQVAA